MAKNHAEGYAVSLLVGVDDIREVAMWHDESDRPLVSFVFPSEARALEMLGGLVELIENPRLREDFE